MTNTQEALNLISDELQKFNSMLFPLDDTYTIPSEIKKLVEFDGDAGPQLIAPQYQNDKLWVYIQQESDFESDSGISKIKLSKLRQILERYKILGDEKDGM